MPMDTPSDYTVNLLKVSRRGHAISSLLETITGECEAASTSYKGLITITVMDASFL